MPDLVDIPVGKAFGLQIPDSVVAQGFEGTNQGVPVRDPDYVFPANVLRRLLIWWGTRMQSGDNDGLAVTGHTGCGKSTVVEQFFNRLNIPVWSLICSPQTEREDIYGERGLVDGNTIFEKGPAVRAAESGGVLLLEEADRLDPTVMGTVAPLTEGKPFRIPGDARLVSPHPGFAVVLTTNSRGGRDETGLYDGARKQNLATMSRFQNVCMGYPSEEVELEILERKVVRKFAANRQKPIREMAKTLRKIADDTRKSFMAKGIDTTISTRVLLQWAHLTLAYKGLPDVQEAYLDALDQALLDGATEDTQQAVRELARARLET